MSDNLVDRNHFSQLMCMYIDLGTETVLKVFYRLIPKDSVSKFFSSQRKTLDTLKSKGVFTSKEYTLLTSSNPNPDRFDISLLITVLNTLTPESNLPQPLNGWHKQPKLINQSVAAELSRLRKIRNNVLCHCPKAELPEVKFEHFWRETEASLLRLIQEIHPEEQTNLKERIKSYRHRETDIAKYRTLLDGWCKEINDVQEQIEAQLRNIPEFKAYFKENPVRYERYIKLLIEGGGLILSAFLQNELDKRVTCFKDWLKENEELLKYVLNDDASWVELYSNTEHYAQLDILLLAKVIRYGFKDLDSKDGEEIEKIQNARENYAENARLSFDSDTFADCREDLIGSLKSLSGGLRNEVRTKLDKLIKECKNRHDDNNSSESETYVDRLRQTGLKMKTLTDVQKETIFELKKSLTQMQHDGIDLKRNHCLEMKLQTVCKNREVAEKAEGDLFQDIKEAMVNAADTKGKAAVRLEVNKLLELICGSDGVEISDVYRGCIIIRITCSTIEGILHIISLFENESFNNVFRNMSSEMTIEFFEIVSIHASLTLESLCEILVHKGDGSHKEQGITMPITVTSAEGLNHVMSLFENRLLDESASRIAKTLSSQFGEKITLQISNDFEGHFQKTGGTSSIQSIPWVPEENEDKKRQEQLLTGSIKACSLEDVPKNGSGYTHLNSPFNQQGTQLILHGTTSEDSDEDDYESGVSENNKNFLQQDIRHVPEEFKNNPYDLKLYTEAISKGEEKDSTIRVNVVGSYGQGKTTLKKRLLREMLEGTESTNGIEIKRCKYDYDQGNLTFSTPKNEDDFVQRIASITHIKDDLDDRNHSHDNAEMHSAKIDINRDSDEIETEETNEMVKIGDRSLGSSKLIPEKSSISQLEQKTFAMRLHNSQNENVPCGDLDIWDFGGQCSFYSTHTLFHSKRAVYLLVFDLTKSLSSIVTDYEFPDRDEEKTMEQYAKFWINSIHAYVGSDNGKEPPVILVGTHKDKLKGDEQTKQEYVEEYFKQIRKLFENTNMIQHIQPTHFAVDNTNQIDTGIVELRKEVIKHGTKLAKKSIPAKWILLEIALRKHSHRKIISFQELMDIDARNEFPLKDEEQVKLFLRYHHSKGTLLYFDEEPISAYVVLDPQYLIDAFKCIVTSKRFYRANHDTRHLHNVLITEARLENELIDKLWRNDTENDFLKHKRELLMFLEKHYIISEALIYCEESQKSQGLGWYIVPSLLRSNSTEEDLTEFLTGRRRTSVRFVMSFNQSPLVQFIFHRLQAALIGRWPVVQISTPRKKALMYENLGVFRLDVNHAGIVEYKLNDIELLVLSLDPSKNVEREWPNKFRRFSEFAVRNEFMKFRHSTTQQENPYNACFKCNDESHCPSGGTTRVPVDDIWRDTKGKRVCRDNSDHEIDPDQILAEWFLGDKTKEMFQDRQLKDKELSQVALAIGFHWGYLGLELGLDLAQIERIEREYSTFEMKIYAMLCSWKANKEDGATINALIHAIKTEKRVIVHWDKFRNILDKISSDGLEN